jgi:rhamnosyltransferase
MDINNKVQHVFIIGSKGIPGAYGGYETFVDKLTEYHQDEKRLKYHVACKSTESGEFEYNNAHCFKIKVPNIGPVQAIYYDIEALKYCCKYIKTNKVKHPIVYILACRIGPFAKKYQKKLHELDGRLYVNPDGHEWMRAKWSKPVRQYWKLSEKLMVKNSDLLICDSNNIEKYINDVYHRFYPKTTYISYGAEVFNSSSNDDSLIFIDWISTHNIKKTNYYLIVGRFVPENNFETMIREFIISNSTKDLVIITNVNDKFLKQLQKKLNYKSHSNIKFVGTVYNQDLLKEIRKNAYAYIHGHEVGGTNPSLLEALGITSLNLLLSVGFNSEVAKDGALYWTKNFGNLSSLIEKTDKMSSDKIIEYGQKAKNRINDSYSWNYIVSLYNDVFLSDSHLL